jgi:hypothetical protein
MIFGNCQELLIIKINLNIMNTLIYRYVNIYMHICNNVYTTILIYAHILLHIYTYMYIKKQANTRIHTHTYIYISFYFKIILNVLIFAYILM